MEPYIERPQHGGTQKLYKFKNGYGASVVNHIYSYGTELAVIKWDNDVDFNLCYTTPITDDVIGYLDQQGVDALLLRIQELPKENEKCT